MKAALIRFGGRWTGCWAVFLSAAFCGCGPRYQFAEVHGKVTYQKEPVAGMMVRFYPISDDKLQHPFATGITDAAGEYTLARQQNKPGALVGKNRVVVYPPSRDLLGGTPAPSVSIPLHYASASESPLIVEVKAGGPNTIDLPLED
jgi:hypothetical protein